MSLRLVKIGVDQSINIGKTVQKAEQDHPWVNPWLWWCGPAQMCLGAALILGFRYPEALSKLGGK